MVVFGSHYLKSLLDFARRVTNPKKYST